MKVGGIGLAVVVLVLVLAVPASAAGLLSQPVVVASAVDKSCTSGQRSGAGVAQKSVTMPAGGAVTARLSAASGDWDLAIIDPSDHRLVAGSAYSGADEVASGFAAIGNNLIVQACRRSGGASTAMLSVEHHSDQHGQRSQGVAGACGHGQPGAQERADRPRARPHRARRPGLRRGGALRRGRRLEARRQQLRVHDCRPGPDASRPGRSARQTRSSPRRTPHPTSRVDAPPTGACSTTART